MGQKAPPCLFSSSPEWCTSIRRLGTIRKPHQAFLCITILLLCSALFYSNLLLHGQQLESRMVGWVESSLVLCCAFAQFEMAWSVIISGSKWSSHERGSRTKGSASLKYRLAILQPSILKGSMALYSPLKVALIPPPALGHSLAFPRRILRLLVGTTIVAKWPRQTPFFFKTYG